MTRAENLPHLMRIYREGGAGHPDRDRKPTEYNKIVLQSLRSEDSIEESNDLVLRKTLMALTRDEQGTRQICGMAQL